MSTVVDLSALGSRGFSVQGGRIGDELGWSVSGAGDVNGDGFDDIIIGAPYADGASSTSGAAYVIFGSTGGFAALDPDHLAAAQGFKIQGNGFSGLSVSGAGDVNGDGFDDVIVASYLHGLLGYGLTQAYVLFGKPAPSAGLDLANLAAADGFKISGPAESSYYATFALSVSRAGDVNGDGFDDLIIGARYARNESGAAYVVFGKGTGFGAIDVTSLAASAGFAIQGTASNDLLGASVASAGDVNGDGYDDIIVGAPRGDLGGSNAGQAYVIFGKGAGFPATIDATTLDGSAGFIIKGHNVNDFTGWSVAGAGDINGDGFDDIIIGSPFASTDAAYVIFGKATGFGTIDLANLGTAGFMIQGSDSAGRSVSAAGDVNHDGFDDVAVAGDRGNAYVIFGKAGGFGTVDLANLGAGAGFVVQGPQATGGDWLVAGVGDVNRDGFADLAVGAPFSSVSGASAGQAFVIGGAPLTVAHDFNGDGRSDILWRAANGTLQESLGQANGSFVNNANVNFATGPEWQVVGTGDFNGDGRVDVLWRSSAGAISDWLGQANGGFTVNGALRLNAGPEWTIVGTGDFNRDGYSDVLWRSDGGAISDWLGQANGGFTVNGALHLNAGPEWHIVGTGDFNGDGYSDVLWRSDGGAMSDWLGQANGGFTVNNAVHFTTGPEWHVVGTGDFNGDGRDDILWRSDDGTMSEWNGQPGGSFTVNGSFSFKAGIEWHVVQTGDFNGDAIDDILWRNDQGVLSDWLGQSNGGFLINGANMNVAYDTSWRVQEPFVHDPFAVA